MLLILSDADRDRLREHALPEDCVFFRAQREDAGCCGCFRCWFEHPGSCEKKDKASSFVRELSKSDELLILSKNLFGSYSPEVKNVLDRSICYLRPSFCIRNGEMRHKKRYRKPLSVRTVFYGQVSPEEKISLTRLTAANAVNLYASPREPSFIDAPDRLEVRS